MTVCPNCNWDCSKRANRYPASHPLREEQINIYGTMCPGCGHFVKPDYRPAWLEENDLKFKLLQEMARDIVRQQWRRANGGRL
jgi:hypothetical protein